MTFPDGTTINLDSFSSIWSGEAHDVLMSHLKTALEALNKQFENYESWKSAKESFRKYSDLKEKVKNLNDELNELDPLNDSNKIVSLHREKSGIEATMGNVKKEVQSKLDEISPSYAQFKEVNYQFVDGYSSFIADLDRIPISLYDKGDYGTGGMVGDNEVFTASINEENNSYVWNVNGENGNDTETIVSSGKDIEDVFEGTLVASYSTVPFHDELNADFSWNGQKSLLDKYEGAELGIGRVSGNDASSLEVSSGVIPNWFKKNVSTINWENYLDLGRANPLSLKEIGSVSSGDALITKRVGKNAITSLVLNNSPEEKVLLVAEMDKKSKIASLRKVKYEEARHSYVIRDMKKYCKEDT